MSAARTLENPGARVAEPPAAGKRLTELPGIGEHFTPRMRCPGPSRAPTPAAIRFRPRLLLACGLAIAFALAGCAYMPPTEPEPPASPIRTEPEHWRAIDQRILAASACAQQEAEAYARVSMEAWRQRVRQRIEAVFIPWYASYWTQQWIATKVAWYQLQHAEGEPTPEQRLVEYLQAQFREQVLMPVGEFVDPRAVMDRTASTYRNELKLRVGPLPVEYGIPAELFARHLDVIPAIVVSADAQQNASLRDVLDTADLATLPAYGTLWTQLSEGNGSAAPVLAADNLDRVAERAVTRLVGTLPLRAGATAASTLVGGFWGLIISAGSAVWSVTEHGQDRQALEGQLRENLDAALEVLWRDLVDDRRTGVTAVVQHISGQIETALLPAPGTPPGR